MRKVEIAVPLAEARRRALEYMATLDRRSLAGAACVGGEIWKGNNKNMTAQGLGRAASRILKTLMRDGLAEWTSTDHNWGYRITSAGRSFLGATK